MTEQPLPANESFWDAVDESADRGDAAGANFGQISITPHRYIQWVDKEPVDVTPEIFNTLPAEEKSLELLFAVDIQGMNPDLEWKYERRMRPGDKDWQKILKPSLIELLGKDSMKKGNYSKALQELDGKYVEAHDVPQIKNPEYGTIKIVRIFASKEECFTAYKERFGGSDSGTTTPASAPLSHPANYTAETWAQMVAPIKAELAKGTSVPDVAGQYQVEVPFIAEIAGQG